MGIHLGILGAGDFAQAFIPLFARHPLVASVSLCDRDPARLAASAARHGAMRTFADYDAMLASDVDAVAIFTQHWMHAPQAVRALDAGKDVYSAVPAAASLAEMAEIVRAVERSGRIYQMGETSAYYSEVTWVRERWRRGDLGALVFAQAEYLHDWDHGLYEVGRRRGGPGWRAEARTWFPMSYPTHSVGMVLSVTRARAEHVSCVGFRDVKPEDRDLYDGPNPFSDEMALFGMSDGSAMRIAEMRRVGHPGAERMCLYGTEACFERSSDGYLWTTKQGVERVDAVFGLAHADEQRRRARLPASMRTDQGHGGSHAFLADDFAKACAWRLQPRTNAWQAARYLIPGLIAHESALRAGERLAVPDLGAGPAVDEAAFERCADPRKASA